MKKTMIELIKKAEKVGFFHLLSANILLQIAGFGGQIFLTRILNVDDIGKLRVLQSLFGIFVVLSEVGMNTAILKICSEKILDDEKQQVLKNGFILSASASILSIAVILFFVEKFSVDSTINELMKLYSLLIPLFVLSNVGLAYMQSQKNIQAISKIQSVSKMFIIIFSITTAFIFGIYGYIIGLVISNLITFLWLLNILKNTWTYMFNWKISTLLIKKLIKFGAFVVGTNLSWQLLISLGIVIANYQNVDNHEIAYFGIAMLIITTMMVIPSTVSQIMIPYISEATRNFSRVLELLSIYEKRIFFLTVVTVTVSFLVLPIVIPIAFGRVYVHSILYFKILLAGLFCLSLYSPKHNTLTSIGRVDLNLYANLISVLVNLVLNYYLIKQYGMYGAAIAFSATHFVAIFVNHYFFKKVIAMQDLKGFSKKVEINCLNMIFSWKRKNKM